MDNKYVNAILWALTNSLGVPSFLQGRKKTGIVRLVVSLVTLGIGSLINGVMGIILAIKIIGMSDEEFADVRMTIDMGLPSAQMLGEAAVAASNGASTADDADYDGGDDEPELLTGGDNEYGYNVLLNDCGYDKNGVLQAIVEIRDCSLEEAIEIVDVGIVLQEVSEEEADEAIAKLRAAGASVEKEEGYDYDEFSPEAMLYGDDEDEEDDEEEIPEE